MSMDIGQWTWAVDIRLENAMWMCSVLITQSQTWQLGPIVLANEQKIIAVNTGTPIDDQRPN